MRAALAGGYVHLCAMANTNPPIQTPDQVEMNLAHAHALRLCRLTQAAAAGLNLKDEVPTDRAELSRVTRVLSNDGNTIFSDDFMRNLLIDSQKYDFVVSTHCCSRSGRSSRATYRSCAKSEAICTWGTSAGARTVDQIRRSQVRRTAIDLRGHAPTIFSAMTIPTASTRPCARARTRRR